MPSRLGVLLSAVVVSFAALVCALSYAQPAKAAYSCSGKHVYPSQNLTSVAGGSPAGTTFCIHDGTYNITSPVRVQNNDTYIGLYDDDSRPQITTTQAHQLFNATGSSGATIKGLTVSGAVGGKYCLPACGRGIRGGDDLTVYNVRATNNMNQGIGGTGPSLLVQDSVIDHNGSYDFANDVDTNTAAGIKSTNSMTILNSKVMDNFWNGVWCDEECGALKVQGSTITGNGKAGIRYEISTGPAVITGNTIRWNGTLDWANQHAGILIVSSAHLDAYNNTFGGNVEYGVKVKEDSRPPSVSDIKIHDNTMNPDGLLGCLLSGVNCYGNK